MDVTVGLDVVISNNLFVPCFLHFIVKYWKQKKRLYWLYSLLLVAVQPWVSTILLLLLQANWKNTWKIPTSL